MDRTFLPGGNRQLRILRDNFEPEGKKIVVAGAGSEQIAKKLASESGTQVELIVEDYDSLMNSKLMLEGDETVIIRIMDFQYTDFADGSFDLVYCQASLSDIRRNKIVKEFKRILKPDGLLCFGEIVNLQKKVPIFIQDIWDNSDLEPLFIEDLEKYYSERKLEIVHSENISGTLRNYYSENLAKLEGTLSELSESEKSYHKKILSKASHESKVYLKQGGDKYIGFEVLLLKKV